MRLLILQYAGDYREAVQHFAKGGKETYYAQKYSVDAVAEVGKQIEEAAVLCCMTAEPYNEVVKNGVRAIGAGLMNKEFETRKIINLIEEQAPTHLVICIPDPQILWWAIKNKVKSLVVLANSIYTKGLRSNLKNYLFANLLNNKQIEWVGSYGINSSLTLQKIGVKSDKIVPWDFLIAETPGFLPPKTLRENVSSWQLLYIGSLIEAKGVGDILEAVAKLRNKNFPVHLKLAGRDENDHFLNKARQLQIEECVEFLGIVPNDNVEPLMREADLVLVPSRHEYPEGFPLTIAHALCSRTPIIVSDHPMFQNNLKHGVSAMMFPAGNSTALSECIENLLLDPELYQQISTASYDAWNRLRVSVKWAEMINRWLWNSSKNQQWLFDHRLASGRYNLTFTQ